jgi:glycosyltransferase involved in cell wall biosynthesis
MDADKFAEKCCKLIDDEDLRNNMGNNSYAYFEESFLIDKRIGELEKIYKYIGGKA